MCGIFGLIISTESKFPVKELSNITFQLAKLSESRGKDSSGMAFVSQQRKLVEVIKGNLRIKNLLKSPQFGDALTKSLNSYKQKEEPFICFGHARLVTNGSQLEAENNQPVIKDQNYLIHNGIIVNANSIWRNHHDIEQNFKIDSEIILSLLEKFLSKYPGDLVLAVKKTVEELEGTFSIMVFLSKINKVLLATNNGSLYCLTDHHNFLIFGSERNYLDQVNQILSSESKVISPCDILQIQANNGLLLDPVDFSLTCFDLENSNEKIATNLTSTSFALEFTHLKNSVKQNEIVIEPDIHFNRQKEKVLFELLENNADRIGKLKRCSKCILPETFPFIGFDQYGVCNYCNHHQPIQRMGSLQDLKKLIEVNRSKIGGYDCLVPFSGGRDSTYTLHILKKEMGLNPLAFTYDWGMVTDLARRNAARVCGKLGVENIIVAADIHRKRENIRKNVVAWLKKPHLGMIPLFMAGDKFFFQYSNQILKQNEIKLSVWGSNFYENTNFKLGFAGIPPLFTKNRIDEISLLNKLRLATFFGSQYFSNIGYLNQSVLESFRSYVTRYFTPTKGFVQFFRYLDWDEDTIDSLILDEYNWEKAVDTNSTWRIGDGTAGFYNYIYYTVAGFSEADTFRSNQIREGRISRSEALDLAKEENFPRFENIRWYIAIIGLDFSSIIKSINEIPKLY